MVPWRLQGYFLGMQLDWTSSQMLFTAGLQCWRRVRPCPHPLARHCCLTDTVLAHSKSQQVSAANQQGREGELTAKQATTVCTMSSKSQHSIQQQRTDLGITGERRFQEQREGDLCLAIF